MMDNNGTFELSEKLENVLPEQRCYTVDDLKDILMCGKGTVYELIKRNEFRVVKLGKGPYRISKKSFDDWLDKQQNTP